VDRFEDFDAFVVARGPALLRTAYLLTGDRHLAEDLLQAALTKSFRHWTRIVSGSPEAYVRQVMARENVSWWRRRKLTELVMPDVPERAAPGDAREQRLVLDQALRRLTAKQRAVLVLRFYDDLSELQTSRVLGCSVGTVKSQTHRALGRLRVVAPELADLLALDTSEPEGVAR
jgi:RNA polymerase sigma-70 factor (sigma-E family)